MLNYVGCYVIQPHNRVSFFEWVKNVELYCSTSITVKARSLAYIIYNIKISDIWLAWIQQSIKFPLAFRWKQYLRRDQNLELIITISNMANMDQEIKAMTRIGIGRMEVSLLLTNYKTPRVFCGRGRDDGYHLRNGDIETEYGVVEKDINDDNDDNESDCYDEKLDGIECEDEAVNYVYKTYVYDKKEAIALLPLVWNRKVFSQENNVI